MNKKAAYTNALSQVKKRQLGGEQFHE